ncbi:hypothetical protein OIDMADRAFT_158030 [Oidiodendron maius Zn]|uniref:Cell surface protein n=1 Tax=Oidiodendron maius (strain Zn) TaxID=913774 RepID=A0A0C3HQX3_OIDMZ|nr:hypothetical protein OIDMADRAFT_158030 [Oidiodendron maius Zn]
MEPEAPPAAPEPRTEHHKTTVLVPLYYYPVSDKTWQPLHDVITAHPETPFLIVINPNSGPSAPPLPSDDYAREVPRLHAYPNVTTVGYVLIDYCRRDIAAVEADIDTYAGWGREGGMALEGILLDESPNHWSAEREKYLERLARKIRGSEGFVGDRLIIHNPGTPPDYSLAPPPPPLASIIKPTPITTNIEPDKDISGPTYGPDIILTCEEPHARYLSPEVQNRLKEYYYPPSRSGYMISGVPLGEIAEAVQELKGRGDYVFATDLVDDFYESFGESWNGFVAAVEGS